MVYQGRGLWLRWLAQLTHLPKAALLGRWNEGSGLGELLRTHCACVRPKFVPWCWLKLRQPRPCWFGNEVLGLAHQGRSHGLQHSRLSLSSVLHALVGWPLILLVRSAALGALVCILLWITASLRVLLRLIFAHVLFGVDHRCLLVRLVNGRSPGRVQRKKRRLVAI